MGSDSRVARAGGGRGIGCAAAPAPTARGDVVVIAEWDEASGRATADDVARVHHDLEKDVDMFLFGLWPGVRR